MISTRDPAGLPAPAEFRRVLQSMALLDAILCPEWELRYYSFDAAWSPEEELASMRDGSGDHVFILFAPAGCWVKGFAHEAAMSPWHADGEPQIWPGVLDSVPDEFAACLTEPAFQIEETTFCTWYRIQDARWQRGLVPFPANERDPDGSEELLSPFDGDPERYRVWAEEYYGRSVNSDAVKAIYAHEAATESLLAILNPAVTLESLMPDLIEIAYPCSARI